MGIDINKVLEKYFGVFLLTSLIWLLFFQNPLESIHPLFKYIDEVVTLVGLIGVIIFIRQYGLQLMSVKFVFITLFLFTIVGLVGNAIYQYQNLKSVLIDTYTNLKFFFAFDVLYFLKNIDYKKSIKVIQINSRLIVGLMFVIFVLDRYLKMFPGEIRYGIRSSALIFHILHF